MRKIHLLPNLITLANAFCGLLAICKGIDALAFEPSEAAHFYSKMATACWLIFLGMLFDAVDGKVARMVGGSSSFGAQLDSFADMLTFGVAPAVLAKVLIEHEAPAYGYGVNPRLHFIAAAVFSVMAILRLARFNLENEPDASAHKEFKGLPSPGAAGTMASAMLLYLTLKNPSLEFSDGTRTPMGALLKTYPALHESPVLVWFLPMLGLWMLGLGFLMVSRVRYVHMFSAITGRGQFVTLVSVVIAAFLLFAWPVPSVFLLFHVYVATGLVRAIFRRGPRQPAPPTTVATPNHG